MILEYIFIARKAAEIKQDMQINQIYIAKILPYNNLRSHELCYNIITIALRSLFLVCSELPRFRRRWPREFAGKPDGFFAVFRC